jgi:glutathione S-transferase
VSQEIVFYTHPMSRGRIVRWMLEEVGAPYRTVLLDYGGTMKAPDYLAINPMGKVPALTHGGVVVTECAAICAYLADAFPQAGLAPPPGDPARAAYYRWLFFAAGPVEAAVTDKALGVRIPPGREAMAGYGGFDRMVDVLEGAAASGDYLAGGRFSAADVYVGSQIAWGVQFGSIEARPVFSRYVERITARPAYIRASQIDDALVAEPAAARETSGGA